MAAEFGDARARLDRDTLDVLEHYKGPGFAEINADLRDGVVDRFTAERWLAITNAIASDRLSEPVAVHRGIAFAALTQLVLDGLEEIIHDGFVSVSLLEAASIGYLSSEPDHAVRCPKGSRSSPSAATLARCASRFRCSKQTSTPSC